MKISNTETDKLILAEFGARLAQQRIDLQLTQAELAHQAGISKRTIERIEAGESTQLANLIRIFRVLGLLSGFNHLIPEAGARPMDLLKLKGKIRQRATHSRSDDKPDEAWTWKH